MFWLDLLALWFCYFSETPMGQFVRSVLENWMTMTSEKEKLTVFRTVFDGKQGRHENAGAITLLELDQSAVG